MEYYTAIKKWCKAISHEIEEIHDILLSETRKKTYLYSILLFLYTTHVCLYVYNVNTLYVYISHTYVYTYTMESVYKMLLEATSEKWGYWGDFIFNFTHVCNL